MMTAPQKPNPQIASVYQNLVDLCAIINGNEFLDSARYLNAAIASATAMLNQAEALAATDGRHIDLVEIDHKTIVLCEAAIADLEKIRGPVVTSLQTMGAAIERALGAFNGNKAN